MTMRELLRGRTPIAVVAIAALLGNGYLLWRNRLPRPERMAAGKHPEQVVYVRTSDDTLNGGILFAPPSDGAKPQAVIWIHGWGVNFYESSYVAIGRALASRGYTTIIGNTRMHDIGTVQGYRRGRRIRGGGYWGVASEQVRDLAAWIDLADARGFQRCVLVGHSAGWAAVRQYQAAEQDPRVVGLVSASGQVYPNDAPDSAMLAEATRLVADGRGDDLLRIAGRSSPSFVSAATYLDTANTPPEVMDFYGIRTKSPAVGRIRCPLLAFFGTRDDVGTAKDLEVIRASIRRQSTGPSRVDAVMIENADHMYHGQEKQVAEVIARWIDGPPRQK